MTSKRRRLELTLARLNKLENKVNAELINQFYNYLMTRNTSETWKDNNLKAMIHFSEFLQRNNPSLTLLQVNQREQIIAFVDSKRKSVGCPPALEITRKLSMAVHSYLDAFPSEKTMMNKQEVKELTITPV